MEYNFDVDEIKREVEAVLKESQGLRMPLNVDGLIEDWLKAKSFFIEAMHGNLISRFEEPVSFELNQQAKNEKLERFIELVETHYNNENLAFFLNILDVDDFYANKTSKDYICGYTVIPKNYKVVKAFKFFVGNSDILKDIQNDASRIIQENTINGYLHLSVHPLDFLSASENVHNWRSCHALDGEYRSGNLNYLMDSSTIICYLSPEKQAILPHFPESVPWNSKKWRMWLFFSEDKTMLFAGRQYPFSNDQALSYIKDDMLPSLGLGKWGPFNETKISHFTDTRSGQYFHFEQMIPVGYALKPLHDVVKNGKDTYMYNDILSSTCYDPLYAYQEEDEDLWGLPVGKSTSETHFTIGEKCRCPICGNNQIDYHEIIACSSCAFEYNIGDNEDYCTCDVCGASAYEDDLYYLELSEMNVCFNCYRHETSICQNCGTVDMPDIIKNYHGRYLCPSCHRLEDDRSKKIIL